MGGTIGDIESGPYTMAFNIAFSKKALRNQFMSIHVTKLFSEETGEIKTKPAQNGIKVLRMAGLNADLLMCRCKNPINAKLRKKIADFSNLEPDEIIDVHNCSNIYKVN